MNLTEFRAVLRQKAIGDLVNDKIDSAARSASRPTTPLNPTPTPHPLQTTPTPHPYTPLPTLHPLHFPPTPSPYTPPLHFFPCTTPSLPPPYPLHYPLPTPSLPPPTPPPPTHSLSPLQATTGRGTHARCRVWRPFVCGRRGGTSTAPMHRRFQVGV